MKKKYFIILLIVIAILTPLYNQKVKVVQAIEKNFVINNNSIVENNYVDNEIQSIDSEEVLYTSDKIIELNEGDTVNFEVHLDDNEVDKKYSIMICCLKVDDNLNEDGIINLIESLGSLENLKKDNEYLQYETLDIKSLLATSFDIESYGKYIFFVLDSEKAIDASKFEVTYEYTIGGCSDSDSSVIQL